MSSSNGVQSAREKSNSPPQLFCFGDDSHRRDARRSHHCEHRKRRTLRIKFVLVLSYLNLNTTCTILLEFKHNICQQFALYCPTCAYQHKQVYLCNCQPGQRSWQQIFVNKSMILKCGSTRDVQTFTSCESTNLETQVERQKKVPPKLTEWSLQQTRTSRAPFTLGRGEETQKKKDIQMWQLGPSLAVIVRHSQPDVPSTFPCRNSQVTYPTSASNETLDTVAQAPNRSETEPAGTLAEVSLVLSCSSRIFQANLVACGDHRNRRTRSDMLHN